MMRALLDANIFFSTWVTDPLLSFADADFFEPLWSERIMDEVCEHLPEVWSRATPTGIKRYVNLLNQAYPDAAVTGWEPLAPAIVLPDTDDRHVVAAAIRGHADIIVTENLQDFPTDALKPFGMQALSPDAFLYRLLNSDPDEGMAIMRRLVASKHHPPRTLDEEVARLRTLGLSRFADLLTRFR